MVIAIGDRIDPPVQGETTTNGLTGRAITFSTAMPDADYDVRFELLERAGGQLGEVYVPEASKTSAGFTFYNEGAAGLAIRWIAQRY